jgi:hypothetical protein
MMLLFPNCKSRLADLETEVMLPFDHDTALCFVASLRTGTAY